MVCDGVCHHRMAQDGPILTDTAAFRSDCPIKVEDDLNDDQLRVMRNLEASGDGLGLAIKDVLGTGQD